MATVNCKIVGGPSKFEFATRYFDRELQRAFPFVFTLRFDEMQAEVGVMLNKIEHEDGSGENWNLQGFIRSSVVDFARIGRSFCGYYSTKRREGVLFINT